MVTVYAIALAVGIVALIVLIMGSAFATNVGRDDRDPNRRIGKGGRMLLAAVLGFGMGGMAAEFSPIGFGRMISLLLAMAAAAASVVWVRFSWDDTGS